MTPRLELLSGVDGPTFDVDGNSSNDDPRGNDDDREREREGVATGAEVTASELKLRTKFTRDDTNDYLPEDQEAEAGVQRQR